MRRLQRRIFFKYFTALSSVLLIVLTVMGCMSSAVLAQQRINEVSENLESAAGKLSAMYAKMPKNSYLVAGRVMETAMDVVKDALNAEVVIADSDGMVVMTTISNTLNRQNNLVPDTALSTVLAGNTYRSNGVFLRLSGQRPSYTVGIPVMSTDNQIDAAVFVTAEQVGLLDTLAPFLLIYMLFAGLSLMIVVAILYFISERMFRPLTQMSQAVAAYADGDFSMRIDVRHDDELGELGTAFNNMADSLGQLESMRRGFVEDVSHELRTPMTTIGGFIDGILDGVIEPDQQEKYLRIVSDEIKRLSRMVSSMLDVSKIQSGTMVYTKSNFDITEILQKNITGFEERIAEKNVKIVWQANEKDDYYVYADMDGVYRIVYNLLDNALKFVNRDGVITLRLEMQADKILTCVRNTGEGIPKKDVGHIFERFYKTDKSRSINKKGVGIGLYLVKTMVSDMGGDIIVSSKEGEFAEFSFTLPRAEEI